MTHKITYRQVIARLEENDLPYGVLRLQNDVSIIISQRGGRIFGPFLSQGSESVFWINGAFAWPDSFEEILNTGDWNLGGERIWIAPEIQYTIQERTDFWGSYHLPEQIDPGHYTLDQAGTDQWRLSQDMTLEAFNLSRGWKQLHLERLIRPVEDPLRNLSNYGELMDGVLFAGYEQSVSLSEAGSDDIMSEAWNLVQLNPGGVLLIPAAPCVEFTDYFEPIDDSLQTIHSNHVRLRITGQRRYKVGYKAPHVFGRLAYFNSFSHARAYLIVRSFFNNPSAPYVEEPAGLLGCHGHSIHVYNDGGDFGGFGELECQGQTVGGTTGRSSSKDQFILWLYVGAPDKVKRLVLHLVGVKL